LDDSARGDSSRCGTSALLYGHIEYTLVYRRLFRFERKALLEPDHHVPRANG